MASDNWQAANGGTEEPFTTQSGHRLLYVFQPSTGRHGYLDLNADVVLSDNDALRALGVL